MGWVLSSTLTLLSVSSCDGSGCCEDLIDKVEANILLNHELGVDCCNRMGADKYPNLVGC